MRKDEPNWTKITGKHRHSRIWLISGCTSQSVRLAVIAKPLPELTRAKEEMLMLRELHWWVKTVKLVKTVQMLKRKTNFWRTKLLTRRQGEGTTTSGLLAFPRVLRTWTQVHFCKPGCAVHATFATSDSDHRELWSWNIWITVRKWLWLRRL